MSADREEPLQAPEPRGRARVLGTRLAQLATLGTAGLWGLSLLASWFRVCELLTHFQLQYFVIVVISSLVFILWQCWRDLAVAMLMVLLTGWQVLPWYIPAGEPTGAAAAQIKIVSANVHRRNRNFAPLLELARSEDPDLLVLLEVDERWLEACQPLRQQFPFLISGARRDNFGIAVFSKLPMRRIPTQFGRMPSIVVDVTLNSEPVTIICTHPTPPLNDELFEYRNSQLRVIGDWLANRSQPSIVTGDLNITMWSPMYRKLESDGKLVNARRGYGIVPTFHTSFELGAIPIDHVLHTKEFRVREFYRGADVDSDHWPVVAVLDLVERAPFPSTSVRGASR